MKLETHLELLGMGVSDLVTNRIGVVVSIAFDLTGCIQAYVTPVADKDGKVGDGWWCDTKRLSVGALVYPNRPTFETIPGGNILPPPERKAAP